jgi:hypothetical protein
MAEIKRFRAWRYNPALLEKIDDLTSPLFDVARGHEPAKNAATVFNKWKLENHIVQDAAPGIYIYYQYFSLPSDPQQYCRI